MAKEVVVWCEICLRDEQESRVLGHEYEVTIDGKIRTVDLCPAHRDEHLGPVLLLLDEFGQNIAGSKRKTSKKKSEPSGGTKYTPNAEGKYECKFPGCGRDFDSPQAIGRHMVSHPDIEGFRAAADHTADHTADAAADRAGEPEGQKPRKTTTKTRKQTATASA